MIIFDEKKYAENILKNASKMSLIKQRDLNILTKYYFYLGASKSETRIKLIEYATKVDRTFNEIVGDNGLEFALRHYGKNKLRVGEPIRIYAGEINSIHALEDTRQQKAIFVILIVAKVFNKIDKEEYYYNGSISDIFKLSKMTGLSKAERIEVIHGLSEQGAIEPNLRGGYKITFAIHNDLESNGDIVVSDFDNVMAKFPAICSICGKRMEGIPKRRTYCDICYEEKRKNDVRKNVNKFRNK